MSSKILIVDDASTARIVLKVQLAAAFYDVLQANDCESARQVIDGCRPDAVILAQRIGAVDGTALCESLRAAPENADLPIVLIVPQDDAAARIAALRAGADDVFERPFDGPRMLARLRGLLRDRDEMEELRSRLGQDRAVGLAESPRDFHRPGRVALVGADKPALLRWKADLAQSARHHLVALSDTEMMAKLAPQRIPDAVIVMLQSDQPDSGLRLLADLRARTDARHAPIIVVPTRPDRALEETALNLGANTVLASGFDAPELALRLETQIRRKRTADRLRLELRESLREALIDPLTGLYNRRYALPQLGRIAETAMRTHRGFAVMLLDLDHFKRVNDGYGHAAGDAVLSSLGALLRKTLRGADMVARVGGEEFLVVMPDTSRDRAEQVAARLCEVVSGAQIELPQGGSLSVTVSIGLVTLDPRHGAIRAHRDLVDEADRALYRAKAAGRNRVACAPACSAA